jgi:hypothetical protein
MAWGPCDKPILRVRRRPAAFPRAPGDVSTARPHCAEFYWDISSAVTKTACLAAFFLIESPRRVAALALSQPEPQPVISCVRWGYRICSCGHHFYCHRRLGEKPPDPRTDPTPAQKAAAEKDLILRIRRRRPWWTFGLGRVRSRDASQYPLPPRNNSPSSSLGTSLPASPVALPSPSADASGSTGRRHRWFWPL